MLTCYFVTYRIMNIGHCALTPISRSDITRAFSFDNHQNPI